MRHLVRKGAPTAAWNQGLWLFYFSDKLDTKPQFLFQTFSLSSSVPHQTKVLPVSAFAHCLSHGLSHANNLLDSLLALLLSTITQEGKHIQGLLSKFPIFWWARKLPTPHQQPCATTSKGECLCARNLCCRINLERMDLFRPTFTWLTSCRSNTCLFIWFLLPLHWSFPCALSTL